MMGIDAEKQRTMMDQSLGAIMALLECKDPVTLKTDWFELRDARLHLKPYTKGGFPIAVASATTPSGALTAGKHGVGMLSLGAGLPGGSAKLAEYWKLCEGEAEKFGKTVKRDDWRLVVNMHCAETDELAMEQVRKGALDLDENGYFIPKAGSQVQTKVPGVYVAGDCADHVYRQAITAAGMGCIAALEAEKYLHASEQVRKAAE